MKNDPCSCERNLCTGVRSLKNFQDFKGIWTRKQLIALSKVIQFLECSKKKFSCGIRNPGTLEPWAWESGKQLKKSGILLIIGIENPSSTDKWYRIQYGPRIWNPPYGIQKPKRLSWIILQRANFFLNPLSPKSDQH